MKYSKIISGVAGVLLFSSSLHAQDEVLSFAIVDMDAEHGS